MDLLWIVLEVLRFSQLIVLSGSVFASQQQLLGRNNNLRGKKTNDKWQRISHLRARESNYRGEMELLSLLKVSFHLVTALNSAAYDAEFSTLVIS